MKRLLYICLLLITVTVSANNVKVTENFVYVDKTNIAIEKLQWYNDYREKGKGVEMPYAIFKVKIKKGAISAKKMFTLDLGGSYMVKETDTEHDNEIWFLVPYQTVNVMLKCGDGCEPIYLFQGKLKSNAVYEGEVIFDDSDYHADEFGSVRWSGNKGLLRKGSILIYNENGDSLYNGTFDQSKVPFLRYQVGKVYTYEIRCPQFKTITDTFVVAYKDQIRDIKIDSMSPNYNFLFVKSTHSKLTYTIDNDTTTFVCNNEVGNTFEGGQHVLHFKAPDYMPKDTIIVLSGDASMVKLNIRLTKESGKLYIKTTPSEAYIQIDGVSQGMTPYTHTLPIGQHKIHIAKSGYADLDTIVTIKKDHITQLQLELNANVKVNFKSSPNNARVSVDGRYVGKTPVGKVTLPIGTHRVTMSATWYKSKTKTVYISRNSNNVFFKLNRILNRPNEFYMAVGARHGQSAWAVGPTFGGYIYGVNIESSLLFGWQKSSPIYWFNTTGDMVAATYYPSVYSINKFGYGIRVGTRFRITPQIGFGYVCLNEKRENGSLRPMADNANAWFGVASVRLSLPLVKHLAFSFTPEYYFVPKLSPGYEAISKVNSSITDYCKGFNGNVSLVVFF